MNNLHFFDIDGVICNNGHRRHLVNTNPELFFSERIHDTINEDVIARAQYVGKEDRVSVLTSRSIVMRAETLDLLEANFFPQLQIDPAKITVSFRSTAIPTPKEKVRRYIEFSNSFYGQSQGIVFIPDIIHIYEDDPYIIELLKSRWTEGVFYSNSMQINVVPYKKDGSREPITSITLMRSHD